MFIETIGHATLLLSDENDKSLLLTDPWLTGSTYWRSWWLQNYPTEEKLKKLYTSKFIYVTHEHSDHFHFPSIKKFTNKTKILIPDLPNQNLHSFLKVKNFNHEIVLKNRWKDIDPIKKISILSLPLWNDDSILILNTPSSIIVNLNDSKPPKFIVKKISKLLKNSKKKSILLSSYSPASIVNSFRVNKEPLSIKSKKAYTDYINKLCKEIKPSIYMPFASQVIFQRKDSMWANEFKVTYEDLKKNWNSEETILAPCYSKINLKNLDISSIDPDKYNKRPSEIINKNTDKQMIDEKNYNFSDKDRILLENKIKKINFFIRIFFRKGIGFKVDDKKFYYSNKKLSEIKNYLDSSVNEDFLIEVPGLVLKDVLNNDHFGDLGITMFTIIHTHKNLDPRLVYLFFILITLDDYGHTKTLFKTVKWIINQFYRYLSFYLKPIKFRS